jgi:hypothetical protein
VPVAKNSSVYFQDVQSVAIDKMITENHSAGPTMWPHPIGRQLPVPNPSATVVAWRRQRHWFKT